MYLLAVHASPRKQGNSEILLNSFLSGLNPPKINAEKIRLAELKFMPCIECGGCEKDGTCILEDALTEVYSKVLKTNFLVIATPIFFYTYPSFLQAFFERFQAFWVSKYLLKNPAPSQKPKGILLALGATKGKKIFECLVRSFKYVLDTIDGEYIGGIFIRGIDKKGEILNHPEFLEKAKVLGQKVCLLEKKDLAKPKDELARFLGLNLDPVP
ncbi:flavodoxin family protein [Thermodesulfobacterium sp. TA1]|uniref:flavodoxin family protein n=1 Tax=Thermodesulfobacterium sp. TA1 TaxID=2234087 RepID=UPI001232EEC7|nr:flavodoxin family protein [Thermodesulfobacterium sp. TA1]QER42734.1 flavodoxin family protein [Thermodesulfobacterium sp. TA1]